MGAGAVVLGAVLAIDAQDGAEASTEVGGGLASLDAKAPSEEDTPSSVSDVALSARVDSARLASLAARKSAVEPSFSTRPSIRPRAFTATASAR
ncbi:hypothetical protein C0989_012235, partial [Termitomyces sp. Mn162]